MSYGAINCIFQHSGKRLAVITDPPFGGRTEPLSHTINLINKKYQKLNSLTDDLPVFWIFPYFMEPQILNDLPHFKMLDYKVKYENHSVFQSGPKGRKQGSPIRIFTNVMPSVIKLPEDEYKYCQVCKKWVAKENRHCYQCSACTSKDGRTYVHCDICERCVKPTWKHCIKCNRCAQDKHKCGNLEFRKVFRTRPYLVSAGAFFFTASQDSIFDREMFFVINEKSPKKICEGRKSSRPSCDRDAREKTEAFGAALKRKLMHVRGAPEIFSDDLSSEVIFQAAQVSSIEYIIKTKKLKS